MYHAALVGWLRWLEEHAALLTLIVAVVAIVIAWVIYRLDDWHEREGVLRALEAELDHHKSWVGNQYHRGMVNPQWADPDYMVFKLATAAVDSAIGRGPGLFVYGDMVAALVRYRQRIETFNQYIDAATYQQTALSLLTHPPKRAVDRIVGLTTQIHVTAIGDRTMSGAYLEYERLTEAIQKERCTSARVMVWALFGW